MRADQGHLVGAALGELAQALDVAAARVPVDLVERRERGDPPGAVRRRRDLAVVEVGVAAVQQPAVPSLIATPVCPCEWPISGTSRISASLPGRMRTLSKPCQGSPPPLCVTQRGPCAQCAAM